MTDTLSPVVRIVDDEETVRSSERFVLRLAGIDSVCYESAEDMLAHEDFRAPGCIVLDLRMDGMSGLELQEELARKGCDLPIVFLSGHGSINAAVWALKKGAEDFLEKPVRPEKLQAIVRGLIERNIAGRERRARLEEKRRLFLSLTPRERDILRAVAAGALNKQIALDLGIAEQTVKIHRSNALHKLQLRTAVDAHEFLTAIGEMPEAQP
jgi:FixJ family two-component response regulator